MQNLESLHRWKDVGTENVCNEHLMCADVLALCWMALFNNLILFLFFTLLKGFPDQIKRPRKLAQLSCMQTK